MQGLVARTGIPKTSVRRTVEKLIDMNWLERHGDRFNIGCRLSRIASLARIQTTIRAAALPYLEDLHARTGETIHLAVLNKTHALIVEKIPGPLSTTPVMRVGDQLPAHCTALGKVLVAHGGAASGAAVLAGRLSPRTTSTITSPARLHRELDAVRAGGVGFDREEYQVGLTCVAAPIRAGDGCCTAAVSVTGNAARLVPARVRPHVQQAAHLVSRALAARGSRHRQEAFTSAQLGG